jgi:hypothetical protein
MERPGLYQRTRFGLLFLFGFGHPQGMPLIWNDLCQMLFLRYFIILFLTLKAWAASTMNQSDIRGLAFRPEPTLIFFVASFAFYRREFSSSKTNLSHRGIASSFLVPTLLSIFIPQYKSSNLLMSYNFAF